jgi:hypothetical protein
VSSVVNSLTNVSKSISKSGFSDLNLAITPREIVLILVVSFHSINCTWAVPAHENLLWCLICFQPTSHPGIFETVNAINKVKVTECRKADYRSGKGKSRGGEDEIFAFDLVLTSIAATETRVRAQFAKKNCKAITIPYTATFPASMYYF